MKGDYEDRRRERKREQQFREKDSKRQINILREQGKIDRLAGEIARIEGETARRRQSEQLDALSENWDLRKGSAIGEISDCPGLSQTIRDSWRQCLEAIYLTSSDAKRKLNNLSEEVKALKLEVDNTYSKGSADLTNRLGEYNWPLAGHSTILDVKPPRPPSLSESSPKTVRRFKEKERIRKELEMEEEKNLLLKKVHLLLIDTDISRLIDIYNSYESLNSHL